MATTNEKTDQQLAERADDGLKGQGAVVDMMSRLKDSIESLNTTTTKLNCVMIWLTVAILLLTAVSVIVTVL